MREVATPLSGFDVDCLPPHATSTPVRRQPVRLSGAEPTKRRDLDRRESQSGQGMQLRLHLLPGGPADDKRDAVRGDGAVAGGAGAYAAASGQRRVVRAREV